jgi:hypothetical protein
MNSFYDHHRDSIRFHYRCFDRILLNGLIQPFQQPERVVGFFNAYRHLYPVSRDVLRGIADQFQQWLKSWTEKQDIPVMDAPRWGRRDEFVDPYFKRAQPDQVVVVLKAREPARVMIAIGDKGTNRWHLQIADRWVIQYNVYINDREWGRMFVRMCPYLPFSARVCLNQHHWLATQMRAEGIAFRQCSNAFVKCSRPTHAQMGHHHAVADHFVTDCQNPPSLQGEGRNSSIVAVGADPVGIDERCARARGRDVRSLARNSLGENWRPSAKYIGHESDPYLIGEM